MKLKKIFALAMSLLMCTCTAYGHSGRTDGSGGHHDYQNKSGLGSYHYHCGGHPAHLHPNGVCPYSSANSGSSSSSSGSSSSSSKAAAPNPNINNVYLMHTMPQMTVGESYTANAVSNNASAPLIWSSSNPDVASVDSTTGTVTARNIGTAVITVSNGYKSASYTVTCKGYISYTNTTAEINGNPIQLYSYNNDFYVLCNDLNNYGFDTTFTRGTTASLVKITRNVSKTINPNTVISYPDGKTAYVVAPTSINVLCGNNTSYSKAVNGDGRMFVAFDSLSTFGNVSHNQYANKIELTTYW